MPQPKNGQFRAYKIKAYYIECNKNNSADSNRCVSFPVNRHAAILEGKCKGNQNGKCCK